jgi:hypothetical protein
MAPALSARKETEKDCNLNRDNNCPEDFQQNVDPSIRVPFPAIDQPSMAANHNGLQGEKECY